MRKKEYSVHLQMPAGKKPFQGLIKPPAQPEVMTVPPRYMLDVYDLFARFREQQNRYAQMWYFVKEPGMEWAKICG